MITDKTFEPYIAGHNLSIDQKELIRLLGHEVEQCDPLIFDSIKKMIEEGKRLANPAACFMVFERSDKENKNVLNIHGKTFHIGNSIASQIRKASHVAFFMVTAGKKIEEKSKTMLEKNEILESYVMDIVGSLIAESVANAVHEEIEKLANTSGLKTTNRFSPGYCNWDVNEQFKLFSLFNDCACGIRLTESALMDPIKSISGMVGIGADVVNKPYKCEICNDDKCIYRSLKQNR